MPPRKSHHAFVFLGLHCATVAVFVSQGLCCRRSTFCIHCVTLAVTSNRKAVVRRMCVLRNKYGGNSAAASLLPLRRLIIQTQTRAPRSATSLPCLCMRDRFFFRHVCPCFVFPFSSPKKRRKEKHFPVVLLLGRRKSVTLSCIIFQSVCAA